MKNSKTVKISTFFILFAIFHSGFADEVVNEEVAEDAKSKSTYCLRCHSMETLAYRDTATGEIINLYVNLEQYQQSNHKRLECTACHTADYSHYPHPDSVKQENLYCLDCHKEDPKFAPFRFPEIEQAFSDSIHAMNFPVQEFNCFSCHDPHQFKISRVGEKISEIVSYDNKICLNCHASLLQAPLKRKGFGELLIKHQWLPNPMLHWRSVRCVECHTPETPHFSHQILPADPSVKKCISCHSKEATLLSSLYKFRSQEDLEKTGWFNKAVFNKSYIIGMSRNETVDRWSLVILILTIVSLCAHGLGRVFTKMRNHKK